VAPKKKLNGKKVLPKKSARKVVKTKAHRKQHVVAATKRKPIKTVLPGKKPVVVVAIEAEAWPSPMLAWARMPFAFMDMWLLSSSEPDVGTAASREVERGR
jgi:hypothetical protein